MTDRRYWDFYKRRRELGDTIILDNGAYEGVEMNQPLFNRVLQMADEINPEVVVLPDVVRNESATFQAARQFTDCMGTHPPYDLMIVPQGETMKEWWSCLHRLYDLAGKYMNEPSQIWIGLARCLVTDRHSLSIRYDLAKNLKATWTAHSKLHALGMANGSIEELKMLRYSGLFESIDSSAPVWRGWLGVPIDDPELWTKASRPVNFSEKYTDYDEQIEINLELCDVI